MTLTNGSFDAVARANLNAEQLIIYNALNTTLTKNTLKDLYAVMDNKKAMQVLLEAKDAKDVIEYLKT